MIERLTISLCLLAGLSAATAAEARPAPGLLGRVAHFQILTYDDPNRPYFQTEEQTASVDGRVEFVIRPEAPGANGLSAVPAAIDVQNRRIEVAIAAGAPGAFAEAAFNGYVLTIDGACLRLAAAGIDKAGAALGLTEDRVFLQDGALFINVSGLPFDARAAFAIELDLQECLVS